MTCNTDEKHVCNGNCKKECMHAVVPATNTCMTKSKNETNKNSDFYLGVDDITVFRGKKDDMKMVGKPRRIFTKKFYKNSKRAAELVFLNQFIPTNEHGTAKDRAMAYDPEILAEFWKKVHYDSKQKTYFYDEYLTIGTQQPPKKCQMECFYKGEYEFIKIHHEIQVLKTELVKAN